MEDKMTAEGDDKCCNRNCWKDHCARHWKNHDGVDAWNLNPYDQTRCANYLPKFRVGMRYKRGG
nr:MAG TPA: hypothetical protein [Caudoviricetes sp.]